MPKQTKTTAEKLDAQKFKGKTKPHSEITLAMALKGEPARPILETSYKSK